MRHARHVERPGHSAHVHDVRLDNVDGAHADHALPRRHVPILFAARDIDIQGSRHAACRLKVPIWHRLLVMADAMILQHAADIDGARHGEG